MSAFGNLPPALRAELRRKHEAREAKRKGSPRRKGAGKRGRVVRARAALRKVQRLRTALQRQVKALVKKIERADARVAKARGKLNAANAAARA